MAVDRGNASRAAGFFSWPGISIAGKGYASRRALIGPRWRRALSKPGSAPAAFAPPCRAGRLPWRPPQLRMGDASPNTGKRAGEAVAPPGDSAEGQQRGDDAGGEAEEHAVGGESHTRCVGAQGESDALDAVRRAVGAVREALSGLRHGEHDIAGRELALCALDIVCGAVCGHGSAAAHPVGQHLRQPRYRAAAGAVAGGGVAHPPAHQRGRHHTDDGPEFPSGRSGEGGARLLCRARRGGHGVESGSRQGGDPLALSGSGDSHRGVHRGGGENEHGLAGHSGHGRAAAAKRFGPAGDRGESARVAGGVESAGIRLAGGGWPRRSASHASGGAATVLSGARIECSRTQGCDGGAGASASGRRGDETDGGGEGTTTTTTTGAGVRCSVGGRQG
eukprot:ctg_1298.g457